MHNNSVSSLSDEPSVRRSIFTHMEDSNINGCHSQVQGPPSISSRLGINFVETNDPRYTSLMQDSNFTRSRRNGLFRPQSECDSNESGLGAPNAHSGHTELSHEACPSHAEYYSHMKILPERSRRTWPSPIGVCCPNSRSAPLPTNCSHNKSQFQYLFSRPSQILENFSRTSTARANKHWSQGLERLSSLKDTFDHTLTNVIQSLNFNGTSPLYSRTCSNIHQGSSNLLNERLQFPQSNSLQNMLDSLLTDITHLFEKFINQLLMFLEQFIDDLKRDRYDLNKYIGSSGSAERPNSKCGIENCSFSHDRSINDADNSGNFKDIRDAFQHLSQAQNEIKSSLDQINHMITNLSSSIAPKSVPTVASPHGARRKQNFPSSHQKAGYLFKNRYRKEHNRYRKRKRIPELNMPRTSGLNSDFFNRRKRDLSTNNSQGERNLRSKVSYDHGDLAFKKRTERANRHDHAIRTINEFIKDLKKDIFGLLDLSHQDGNENETRLGSSTSITPSIIRKPKNTDVNILHLSTSRPLLNAHSNTSIASVSASGDNRQVTPEAQIGCTVRNFLGPINHSIHDVHSDVVANEGSVTSSSTPPELDSLVINKLSPSSFAGRQAAAIFTQNENEPILSRRLRDSFSSTPVSTVTDAAAMIPFGGLSSSFPTSINNGLSSTAHLVQELRELNDRGASKKTVQSLPTKKFEDIKPGETVESVRCWICLTEFVSDSILKILPCRHAFHKKCIEDWLRSKKACPSCPFQISG